MKYRNRVRSRISNLKDPKNPNLRRNVLCGAIAPALIARMTAEVHSAVGLRMGCSIPRGGLSPLAGTENGIRLDIRKNPMAVHRNRLLGEVVGSPSPEVFNSRGDVAAGGMVCVGWWWAWVGLDLVILEVFSNLNDSMSCHGGDGLTVGLHELRGLPRR